MIRTVEEILAPANAIVEEAEKVLETDTYYQKQEYDMGKLSYKYGRITTNLAHQILDLKRQIERLKIK